jgi:hypothetical protein
MWAVRQQLQCSAAVYAHTQLQDRSEENSEEHSVPQERYFPTI